MIDVMLVLLIIFMIVTPAISSGPVSVPRAMNGERNEAEPGEIRLGIDRDGRYYLDLADPVSGAYSGPRPLAAGDLSGRLTALYANRSRDRILYLKADENLAYGTVESAINVARQSGVRVVAAIVEHDRKPQHAGGF